MRYIPYFLLFFSLVVCQPSQAERPSSMPFGTWSVKSVNGILFNSLASVINTKDKFYVQGPCNRYFGAFVSKEAGFKIGLLGLTRMYCQEKRDPQSETLTAMQEESVFVEALQKITSASRKDDMLILEGSGDFMIALE